MTDTGDAPEFMTTKEIASLLRVRERRVYELASAGEIPCRRATGKLLFPRDEIRAWMDGGDIKYAGIVPQFPNIVAGSHDPLLDWAIRESGSTLATRFDGSLDGVQQIRLGKALAAGVHIFDPKRAQWNMAHVTAALVGKPVVMIEWARRRQCIILSPELKGRVRKIEDLKGLRIVQRQETAGAAILFNHLLKEAGLGPDDIDFLPEIARTETEAAAAVAAGKADAAPGLEAVAEQFNLGILPTKQEIFDLIVYRRAWFEQPMQRLLSFCRTSAFAARAEELGGYDIDRLGAVRWIGP